MKRSEVVVDPFGFTVPFKVAFTPEMLAEPVVTLGAAEGVKLRIAPEFDPFILETFTR